MPENNGNKREKNGDNKKENNNSNHKEPNNKETKELNNIKELKDFRGSSAIKNNKNNGKKDISYTEYQKNDAPTALVFGMIRNANVSEHF